MTAIEIKLVVVNMYFEIDSELVRKYVKKGNASDRGFHYD